VLDEPDGKPPPADQEPALPLGLDLLWGRRERGQRGPKPGLSLDAIINAAIQVADAQGLQAISMSRVATELGFTTMALYRYVNNKDELLALMWNASAQGMDELVLEGHTWRERLQAWVLVQRDAIDRHPWITQMPMAAPPAGPNSLAFVERGLATLDDTDLPDHDKLRIIGLLSSYTLSEARMAHDAARASTNASSDTDQSPAGYEALLRLLVNQDAHPRLHRIAWDASAEENQPDERAEFAFGVDRILDGVQTLIDQSKRSTHSVRK
jgi:AcrR family transcriptional regulator